MPQFNSVCPGVRWITVQEPRGGGTLPPRQLEICVAFSTSAYQYVLLKKEGRVTEVRLRDFLSLPYVSGCCWDQHHKC